MKKGASLFCLLIACTWVKAQSGIDQQAVADAIAQYHVFLQPEAGLYNGRQYVDYAQTIQTGDPFFMPEFAKGSVVYNNMLYQNVSILFDEVQDAVVIYDPARLYKLSLNNERVSEFTILDHRFVYMSKDSVTQSMIKKGYYEVLYSGKIKVYKRQHKNVQEELSQNEGVRHYIDLSVNYYLEKDNRFYEVNSQDALLDALEDKKSEVQRFIKKSGLRFKRDKDATLAAAARQYDELKTTN